MLGPDSAFSETITDLTGGELLILVPLMVLVFCLFPHVPSTSRSQSRDQSVVIGRALTCHPTAAQRNEGPITKRRFEVVTNEAT
jgi:hypothetical protein